MVMHCRQIPDQSKKTLTGYLQEITGMPKPDKDILMGIQFLQICLDRRNGSTWFIARVAMKHKIVHHPAIAAPLCERGRGAQVLELSIFIMLRLLHALQSCASCGRAKLWMTEKNKNTEQNQTCDKKKNHSCCSLLMGARYAGIGGCERPIASIRRGFTAAYRLNVNYG